MTESEQKPLFFIDDVGDHTTNQLDISNCEPIVNENYFGNLPPPSIDIFEILRKPTLATGSLLSDDEEDKKECSSFERFCKDMGWLLTETGMPRKRERKEKNEDDYELSSAFSLVNNRTKLGHTDVGKEMKGSVLNCIELQNSVPKLTDKKAAKLRKTLNDKSKGKNWFNIPATEITEEVKQDLEVIQMRSALDPTRFYKKNDLKTLPKYFQVGTVLPSPLERNEPGVRTSKKLSLVDELLKDAEFQQFNKRKYQEVQAEKNTTGYKRNGKKRKRP